MVDIKKLKDRVKILMGDDSYRVFAAKSGVSDGTIRRAVAGKISDKSLKLIARENSVTVEWLSGETDEGGPGEEAQEKHIEMGKCKGFTETRHREIGVELYVICRRLNHLMVEFSQAYPRSGPLGRAAKHLDEAVTAIMAARDQADENLFQDFPDREGSEERVKYYYPDSNIPSKTMLNHLAGQAELLDDLISAIDKQKKWQGGNSESGTGTAG